MTRSIIHCLSRYCRLTAYFFVATQLLASAYKNWHFLKRSSAKSYYQEFLNLKNIKLERETTVFAANDRAVATSSRQNVAGGSQQRRKEVQPLVTSLDRGRIRIGGQRWILPGDYIVHEEYGVGRYLGVRLVDLTPARPKATYEPSVIVQYADGEVSWFLRIVEKELWLYRSADAGEQELSSLIDRRKWKRRKISVEESSRSMAVNLSKMKAIRDAFHRTPCAPDSDRYLQFEKSFTFDPTEDQKSCFQIIASDMINNTRPMDRLVCGDVGFGKTEVAIRAIYRAVLSKKQVAFLAPTRILALQHLRVLQARMPDVNIQLLRGGGKGDALLVKEMIKTGQCEVVVGTHALLQPTVSFTNLGLLIIDEEQRFGVGHKEKLKAVSGGTDVLTLSATPIPRTLQMSMANLRDLSLMNTAPVGRREVNVSVSDEDNVMIKNAIVAELKRGGQVFVVVPFVRDVGPTHDRIVGLIPGLKVTEAHGRHDDLEDRIDYFSSGQADVLVATTVIENGVDMPNVNTIIVLSAERFGMSALYQLRGRVAYLRYKSTLKHHQVKIFSLYKIQHTPLTLVTIFYYGYQHLGRSTRQAYAYFMTNSTRLNPDSELKLLYLSTLTALGSGYELSRRDMEMRGFGTIFGADQSGTCDVGLDLQANILETAAKRLNKECILSISDCRISIQCSIENFGTNELGPLPSSAELSAVSRWEASLAEKIITNFSPKGKNAGKGYYEDEVLRNYLATGTAEAAIELKEIWMKQLKKLPAMLDQLLKRSMCRMSCRRLSIHELRRSGRHALFLSASIDKVKWEGLQRSVPEHLKDRVRFEVTARPQNSQIPESDPESSSLGVMFLSDVFPADDTVLDGKGDGMIDLTGMPSEILDLLLPLSAYVDKLLNDAILACDPDKEEKDKAKADRKLKKVEKQV